ncbi:hypothetical protein [Butyrivibrio sp. M55]|uniref:hypothetical protein n=1 Tax=Butyrivibrio sp. M55 TaxID=1855323 RepID=UPI0008EFC004|nr:hypothetical protein [Butyrivibrio sp. M55]SFU79432.1 hypothetical protein SAMN05216540_11071 [Butyrivibrio sp. M55]
MRKINVGLKRSFMKMMGVAMMTSLLLSVNVHAEEENVSEDIATIEDGIDTLDDKVDALNDKCQDEELSDDISGVKDFIAYLSEQISTLTMKYTNELLTAERNRHSIINGLNKSVYANDNISENASYSDIISKINNIKYQGTLDASLDNNGKYTLESGYYEGGTIDISAIVEAARQEGKEEGFKEGEEKGFKEGKEEGYKAGKEDGLKEGRADGDKAGYSRGLTDGKKQGEEAGREDIMTNGRCWMAIDKTCTVSLSPIITHKSYKYFYIKNTNTHGTSLNSNDVVKLWIQSGDNPWGRVVVDTPISNCTYVGDGWYQCGVTEGISMVQVVNNNNVPRDYMYKYSD